MEEGMVSRIFHQALVILSEAKDPFQPSGITNKTVIHPERTVILPPEADQDLLVTGP